MTRHEQVCLWVSGTCLMAFLAVLALLIWGPEVVVAALLALGASVGVTVCLAMMADGQ